MSRDKINRARMENSVTAYIQGVLQIQAEPPRKVKYAEVLRVVFKEKSYRFVFFFGFSMLLLFILATSSFKSSERFFFLLFGLIPLLIAAVPFYSARRIFNAIKNGVLLLVEVESVEYSIYSRNTLNALENGFAQGTWRLPEGRLINFQIDQPWAKYIKIGSLIEVLVVSPIFNGIFPLGLHG